VVQELLAKPIVDSQIEKLQAEVQKLKKKPSMKVVLVGENQASKVYINHKKKKCEQIGADFELIHLPEETSEVEFLSKVKELNQLPTVNGLFIQLPLPKHLSHIDTTNLVDPEKDVDGFHYKNVADIYSGNISSSTLLPCTPKGILSLLDFYKIDISGKHVVVIGRSLIVGKPMGLLCLNRNATVTYCHSRTQNIQEFTKKADIIISAVGKPKWLNSNYIEQSKKTILIDVGINRDENNKLCGDIDFDDVKDNVSMMTPVPGGVGPLTVLSLMENLLIATKKQKV
jgi:methylenetetrahydrofolate dehydrogenase (NADP+)/methenyltetrahydrofolate cyclohydrolase